LNGAEKLRCDIVRCQLGEFKPSELARRIKAGEYKGVSPEDARALAKLSSIGGL
jgi:hypothetical protein